MNTFTDHQVLHGDCTQLLNTLPPESVDLVLTDPPYGIRYRERADRTIANDDDLSKILYAFDSAHRVLKRDAYCISFYGWSSAQEFLQAWRRAGFTTVGHIVWQKRYASSRRYLAAHHEQAYLLAKGRPTPPARVLQDVQPWHYTGNSVHPTQKSVRILRPLIEAFSPPGGRVLDPFGGVGSTAVAAARCGRRSTTIELDATYCDIARRRLALFAPRDEGEDSLRGFLDWLKGRYGPDAPLVLDVTRRLTQP